MNYLALTIGPIVETLSESKKTKELFAGSYLFSYFMRELLVGLKKLSYAPIVPYHTELDSIVTSQNGIGMFHDRLVVSHDSKEQNTIQEDINRLIENMIDEISIQIISFDKRKNAQYEDLIKAFFTKYFQISYVIRDKFSFKKLNNTLDIAELHREFSIYPDDYKVLPDQRNSENKKYPNINPLRYLQQRFQTSFLKIDALGENEKSQFPSVLEIALNKSIPYVFNNESYDEELEKEALKGKKNHKKYMAFIQGDGDKIGAILKNMDKEPDKIRLFSEKLLEYTLKIPKIAKKYNATVVYAGGDDMLAFAPIIDDNKNTVFDFLLELDNVFRDTMKELDIEEANHVSQSFGVSLVYYKKPLYQALSKAITNLFYVAKSNDNQRNRAVVELIKHSGQTYVNDMTLNSNTYNYFNQLLVQELNSETAALPHAVTHNLSRSMKTLEALALAYDDMELSLMLDNFFKNNFNKEVHKYTDTEKALHTTKLLLLEHMKDYQNEKNEKKEFASYFNHFAALLSMIKHLRGDR